MKNFVIYEGAVITVKPRTGGAGHVRVRRIRNIFRIFVGNLLKAFIWMTRKTMVE
jgi:hypothetical protein